MSYWRIWDHEVLWNFHPHQFSFESENVSRSVMSGSLQPHGLQPASLLGPWNSSEKNTAVGCHSLLQGNFLTQVSNLSLPHCRQILKHAVAKTLRRHLFFSPLQLWLTNSWQIDIYCILNDPVEEVFWCCKVTSCTLYSTCKVMKFSLGLFQVHPTVVTTSFYWNQDECIYCHILAP